MTILVIVESPKKVKTIGPILGDRYTVMASVGHVRDLPSKEMGLEPPSFALSYEATERGRSVLAKLKAAAKDAEAVILATDPDREGEAISWHLAEALKLKNPQRVTFTAITKDKILAAFAAPRALDMQRVHAQEARRALDRIIGYRVSPALSDATGQRIGAGRVQSPAVRLVVDLERAIAAFKPTQHYGAELIFTNDDATSWKAQFDTKPHLAEGEKYLLDDALAKKAAALRNVTVAEYSDSEESRAPKAPFTTSTLQQAAGQRLKLKPKETMSIAQSLYDQGLITYLRTDSPNIDDEGVANIAAYAQGAGLPLSDKPRKWKAKEGAQEGHEAIRPTQAENLDCGADDAEKALYRLIWQRAVASQLADAVYAVRTVRLDGDAEGTPVSFKATGKTLTSPGWQAVYAEDAADEDSEKDETSNNPIPALAVDAALVASDGRVLSKKTKPPVRYKLPTLVMEMEKLGIGRPSTYAAILDNIMARDYIAEDKKGYLLPSSTGEILRDGLVDRFAFIDLDYTRGLEDQLDQIAEGKATYIDVVSSAWASLDDELANLEAANLPIAHPCPTCAKALRRIKGTHGFFWSCSDRECKTTLPDAKGKPGERKAPPAPTGIDCPKCGTELAHRVGTSKPVKRGMKPRPYDFYSCTSPKCDAKYNTGADGKPVFGDDAPAAKEAS
ncbi:type I DNA topoisomerase [Pseudomonas juntendi]|uniref:DNA topoisomerase 1 n=1 Tax=Pseudomonas juntendi TaxID=2666183 RepID=A0A7W2JMG1_9PSED|nr:type I DNA topoisomerase [Pseudomonas juntendi]EJG5355159.1 type I DNA topoisomerase [Salmonella enterica]EPL59839.1 DNA topoisomerase I [Stutzerimonas stutzeri B1SMN1]MBA6061618.1 type I DNA topoisomerase [Pseudomonas juntendi]